jgi:hypothetical protein
MSKRGAGSDDDVVFVKEIRRPLISKKQRVEVHKEEVPVLDREELKRIVIEVSLYTFITFVSLYLIIQ